VLRDQKLKYFGYKEQQEILDTVLNPDNGIEFVRIIFPDILGRHMDFAIPSQELKTSFKQGKGFDGSSIEGFVRIEESDLIIKPEASTFKVLKKAAQEFKIDDIKLGPELEFFIFPGKKNAQPLDEGGYFFGGLHGEIRKEIQILLKKMGIESEYDHHEVANGQHEIDLKYLSALEMADVCMTFRYMVKKVARMHNLYATFMPKPLNGQNGSGMHIHQSLWRKEENIFFEKKDPYHLSDTAKHYTAGLIRNAPDICAVLCQWTNSYKRLIVGYEAPVYIAWGQKNRSAYIRVPEYQPGKKEATRIELRSPDPACNLYLCFATTITAGLDGIRKKSLLPKPVEDNIFNMSRSSQKKLHINTLPSNLYNALRKMKKSKLVREALGEHLFQKFLLNKKYEIEQYNKSVSKEFDKQVSEYEIEKYLPVL